MSPRLVLPMLIDLLARYSLCAHRLSGWGAIPPSYEFILCNASRGPDATVLSSHFFEFMRNFVAHDFVTCMVRITANQIIFA